MPRTPVRDPDWEPFTELVKLRFTVTQLSLIDRVALQHGVSRSWLLRQAIAEGLPRLVAVLEDGRERGMSPRATRRLSRVKATYRGPAGERPGVDPVFGLAPGAAVDRRSLPYPPDGEI